MRGRTGYFAFSPDTLISADMANTVIVEPITFTIGTNSVTTKIIGMKNVKHPTPPVTIAA